MDENTVQDEGTESAESIVPQEDIEAAEAESTAVENGSETQELASEVEDSVIDDGSTKPVPSTVNIFDQLLQEENAPKVEDDLSTLPEGIKPGSKSAERFQKLANTNREFKERLAQYETGYTGMQQRMEQMQSYAQQQIQQAQQQNQLLQTQIAMLSAQIQKGQQPDDPVDNLKRDWMKEMEGSFQKTLKPYQEKISYLENLQKQQVEQQQIQQTTERHKVDALGAARDVVLRGCSEEALERLAEPIAAQILVTAGFYNTTPQEAAKMVRANMLLYGSELTKARSNQVRGTLKKGANSAPSLSGRPSTGRGQGMPSDDVLRKEGLDPLGYAIKYGVSLPRG